MSRRLGGTLGSKGTLWESRFTSKLAGQAYVLMIHVSASDEKGSSGLSNEPEEPRRTGHANFKLTDNEAFL